MEGIMTSLETARDRPLEDFHVDFGGTFHRYARAWKAFTAKKLERSWLPDVECMEVMDIKDDLEALFERLGMERLWRSLIDRREDHDMYTSTDLVRELLSTLRVRKAGTSTRPTSITFRLGGVDRRLTMGELNVIIGCKRDEKGRYFNKRDGYIPADFWREIACSPFGEFREYKSVIAKCTMIRNPVLCYLEKILSNVIFGKSEGGTVSHDELYTLYCFVYNHPFNAAAYLVLNWEKYYQKVPPTIKNGCVVSLIARHFNVVPQILMKGSNLTTDVCERAAMLRTRANQWGFLQFYGDIFPLPWPELTTVLTRDPENLNLLGEYHLEGAYALFKAIVDEGRVKAVDPLVGTPYYPGGAPPPSPQQSLPYRQRRGPHPDPPPVDEREEEDREVEEMEAGGSVPMDPNEEQAPQEASRQPWLVPREEWLKLTQDVADIKAEQNRRAAVEYRSVQLIRYMFKH